jgi:ubiquitin carboxyl-terminal hydrolase L5
MVTSYSPVYGVIFLFKWSGDNHEPTDGIFDKDAATDKGLFFAAQTIQNACGTQAILSVILNNDTSASGTPVPVEIGPELASFKEFTQGFPPDLRGEALSNSEAIRTAHNAYARSSPFVDETQRTARDDSDSDLYHFIAYTHFNGVLYELDGLQPFPISHGTCDADTFPERISSVLKRRIARYPEAEIRFNLMAVVRDQQTHAREIGDSALLERHIRKRRLWAWENALRRTNFVGFIGEVLKGVVGKKVQDGTYEEWVAQAKQETRRRYREGRQGM